MMFSRGLGSRTNGSPVWELTSNGWNGFAIIWDVSFDECIALYDGGGGVNKHDLV